MPKSTRYFYDAVHYTVKGCREVSAILSRDLGENPVIREYMAGDTLH